ncbi:MAG: N-acetylmuramoyl-L-alanine amidase, partial [Vicinamibacterales bacterium]
MTQSARTMMPTALAVIFLCAGPVALSSQVRPFPQPASADSLIRDAAAKETAVRKALNANGASASILKAVRTVVGDYEGIVRRHPSSAVGDDALWRAGKLSRDAFESFRDARERSAALRLFQQLSLAYPTSEFAKQAPDQMAWLLAHGATPTAAERLPRPTLGTPRPAVNTEEPRAALVALRTAPADPVPALLTAPVTAPSKTNLVSVKAIRRTVLADVVRVVIELDGEVAYHDERLDAPNRVFVDLPTTRANLALQDQTIRFDDDTDIVRLIRVGRHPNNTTRVVLEGAGIASYSVYPAYSPFRLVIDCIRTKPVGSSVPLGNYKVAAARPPAPIEPRPAALSPVVPALLVTTPAVGSPTVNDARPSATPNPGAATTDVSSPDAPSAERPAWATALKSGTAASRSVAPVTSPAPPILRSQRVRWRMPLPSLPVSYLPEVAMVDPVAAVVDTRPTRAAGSPETPEIPADVAPAPPARNVAGGLSMARQLGLGVSRIVIDPGHGGHDPGAQSSGVTESELVLDVALRLEKLLSKVPGVDVVMTRRENEFITLQERTAIANRESADLFLSIHA